MKVPTYKRQTVLPTKTGGGMLSARANPNLFGLPGAAKSQFGETTQNQGLAWLKKEIEVENATELASETNTFEKSLTHVQDSVYTGAVEFWRRKFVNTGTIHHPVMQKNPIYFPNATAARAGYKAKLLKDLQRQSTQISSRAVRTKFLSAGRQRITTVMNGLGSHLRTKYAEFGQSEIDGQLNDAIRQIARTPRGNMRAEAESMLRVKLRDYQNIYGFTEKWRNKRYREILSGVDEHEINAELTKTAVTSAELFALEKKINTPLWKNLSVKARDRLTQKIHSKARTLASQEDAAALRQDNQDHKDAERRRRSKFDQYADRIATARGLAAEGKDPAAKQKMPTMAEIIAIPERQIISGGKDKLLQKLAGADSIYNFELFGNFQRDIYDAVTEDDLEFIDNQIRMAESNNFIGAKAGTDLRTLIKGKRNKTPQFVERSRFADLLKQSISAKPGMFSKFADTADLGGAEAAILSNYETRVNRGMRPQEAFYQALTDHGKYKDDAVQQHLMTVDPSIKKALFGDDKMITIENVRNLTLPDIERARDAWSAMLGEGFHLPQRSIEAYQKAQFTGPRDERVSKKDRLTVRGLYAMEAQLDYLEGYVRHNILNMSPKDRAIAAGATPLAVNTGSSSGKASDRNKKRKGRR